MSIASYLKLKAEGNDIIFNIVKDNSKKMNII